MATIFDEFLGNRRVPEESGYKREKGILIPAKPVTFKTDFVEEKPEVSSKCSQQEKVKIESRKRSTRVARSRLIQVFDMKSLETARERVKRSDKEQKDRLLPELDLASKNDGKRLLPKLGGLPNILRRMQENFPNFSEPISAIGEEFAFASASRASGFRFSPMLLDGVPGIGKTAFAQELARSFELPFLSINAGNMQCSAAIVGTASHWSNAAPGDVFSLFASGESASGVVLIDEVDKLSSSREYPVLPALLTLLEPETSRTFKDVSMNVVLDASRLFVMMTSNYKNQVDKALLSRARIFEIAEPDQKQRVAIVNRWLGSYQKEMGPRIKLRIDPADIERLAELPTDLRALQRNLRSAYGRALLEKLDVLRFDWGDLEQQKKKSRPIGFAQP